MNGTIGDFISGLRNTFKAVSEDAFVTDRYIYFSGLDHAKAAMRRQKKEGKIMSIDSLFETLPDVELMEVDKADANCSGITTGCTIMRTKNKLPKIVEGDDGPIIRLVSPIDYSSDLQQTTLKKYIAMSKGSNFRFNKTKYFWFKEGYLYFPNIMWDAVAIEAIFEEPINCCDGVDECMLMQDAPFFLPDYLIAEIKRSVKQEDLGILVKIPSDTTGDNSQQILR